MSARILVVDDVDVNVRLLEAKLTIEYYDENWDLYEEELDGFRSANPNMVRLIAQGILETEYTFNQEQMKMILSNEDLLEKFAEVNSKIDNGIILIKSSKTQYMAKSLGFNKTYKSTNK